MVVVTLLKVEGKLYEPIVYVMLRSGGGGLDKVGSSDRGDVSSGEGKLAYVLHVGASRPDGAHTHTHAHTGF